MHKAYIQTHVVRLGALQNVNDNAYLSARIDYIAAPEINRDLGLFHR